MLAVVSFEYLLSSLDDKTLVFYYLLKQYISIATSLLKQSRIFHISPDNLYFTLQSTCYMMHVQTFDVFHYPFKNQGTVYKLFSMFLGRLFKYIIS